MQHARQASEARKAHLPEDRREAAGGAEEGGAEPRRPRGVRLEQQPEWTRLQRPTHCASSPFA